MPKISELPVASALVGTDYIAAVVGGVTSRILAPDFVESACRARPISIIQTKAAGTAAFTNPLFVRHTYQGNNTSSLEAGAIYSQMITPDFWGGTVHGLSNQTFVGQGGTEAASIFSQLVSKGAARLWGIDHHVHGPGPGESQPNMMVGIATLLGNYNAANISNGSVGISVQAWPGIGPLQYGKEALRSYPNDIGFLVNGVSATPGSFANKGPGFKVGFQTGGVLGPWDVAESWVQVAFKALDFDTYGLHVSTPRAGTTPHAIVTDPAAGKTGLGTLTPTQRLEVNGGVRLETADARPAADADSAGTFWRTKGGPGAADVVEVCVKLADGSFAWKTLTLA